MKAAGWSDERVEMIIGICLRAGVMIAAAIVATGGILYLVRHGFEPVRYSVFQGESSDLRGMSGILSGALALRSRNIIQLGVLFLIATPVARVAFSVIAFALQKDRAYVFITLAVLGILLFSLAGGAPGA